jgi:DNA-binding transcriptional MerR regulator
MQGLSVRDAARALGLSEQAIRSRIHRGSIDFERADDGGVLVIVPEDVGEPFSEQEATLLVEALQERIQSLERHLERLSREAEERDRENRRLLAAALERIPAIEPPQDERASPEAPRSPPKPQQKEDRGTTAPPEEEKRSWWRRLFEG